MNSIGSFPEDIWLEITKAVAKSDWRLLINSLPLVNRDLRAKTLDFLEKNILPILSKIETPEMTLSSIRKCQRLMDAVEKKTVVIGLLWQKPLHKVLGKMLLTLDGEEAFKPLWQSCVDLIEARANVNAINSSGKTPLLQVFDDLGWIYAKGMTIETRTLVYKRIYEITKLLLEAGANPNLGRFSTPLTALFFQKPPSPASKSLMQDLAELCIQYGADVDLVPKDDCYGLGSPRELAKQYGILFAAPRESCLTVERVEIFSFDNIKSCICKLM